MVTLVPGVPLEGVMVTEAASTGLGSNQTNPSTGNSRIAANKATGQSRATQWNKRLQNTKKAHQKM